MRVIAGTLRGRRIEPPEGLPVRPTTDMARESLFNILNNYVDFEECKVLDLFAGTGAVSYEFVSRGATSVTSVDYNGKCTDFIKSTVQKFNISNQTVLQSDAFEYLKRCRIAYDIIFADPPYDSENIAALPDLVFNNGLLSSDGIMILEHSSDYSFEQHPKFWQQRRYGKVNFTFFAMTLDE